MATGPIYMLDVVSRGCAMLAGLNGVPIFDDVDGTGIVARRTVNEWLLPAGNALAVVAAHPERASPSPDAAFQMRIYQVDRDAQEQVPTVTYATFRRPFRQDGWKIELPFTAEVPFDLADPPPSRVFDEAEPVAEMTEGDRAEVIALVEKLRAAIASGRAEDGFEVCAYRFQDETYANGFDLAKLRAVVVKGYARIAGKGVVRSDPLEARDARFTPFIDGRLHLVTRGPREPAVAVHGERSHFSVRVYVAKVRGRWVIAR